MNTVTEMATFQAVPVEPGDRGCEAGDMSDVMFAIAAFQLESMDIDLSAKVLGLKHLTEIKNAYRERIDDLNDLLGRIPEGEDGTRVGVQEGIESDFEWDEESGCVVDGGREPIGDPVVLDESGEPVSAILEIDEEDAPAADDSAGQLALARSVAASTPGATVEIGVTRAALRLPEGGRVILARDPPPAAAKNLGAFDPPAARWTAIARVRASQAVFLSLWTFDASAG